MSEEEEYGVIECPECSGEGCDKCSGQGLLKMKKSEMNLIDTILG